MAPASAVDDDNVEKKDNEEYTPPFPLPLPPITNETLQYRLDTGNIGKSSGQRSSLTRCVQKFGILQTKLLLLSTNSQQQRQRQGESGADTTMEDDDSNENNNENEITLDDIEISKDDLIREIQLFELEMTKMILYQQKLQRQMKINENKQKEREQQIDDLKQQIVNSSATANKSRETQNCLFEYETIAKLINEKHPTSKQQLQRQINKVKEETAELDKEIATKDQTLNVRGAQYQLLIQYMLDLKQSLKEDEEGKGDDDGGGKIGDIPVPMDVDDDNLYGDL